MTYLQAHKRPYRRLVSIIAVIGGLIVVVVVSVQIFIPHLFPALFTSLARPFWRAEFSIESSSLRSPEALLRENQLLIERLKDAEVRLGTIRAIEAENEELKILMGRQPLSSSSLDDSTMVASGTSPLAFFRSGSRILSAVLVRPPLALYDDLIIDSGERDGVTASTTVYAAGDVLIGRVIDVMAESSKVRLFSSPGERYEVLIGSSHAPATAIGRGGGQYEAHVSREVEIKEGDFVLNPSLSDRPFGVVVAVLSDPAQTFETILFAPPVNIYQLRWVLVETGL